MLLVVSVKVMEVDEASRSREVFVPCPHIGASKRCTDLLRVPVVTFVLACPTPDARVGGVTSIWRTTFLRSNPMTHANSSSSPFNLPGLGGGMNKFEYSRALSKVYLRTHVDGLP